MKIKNGNKKINNLDFMPFEDFIEEECQDPEFKKLFLKEMASARLALDLKYLRVRKKMTQKQLATKTKMPQSVIARLESGRHGASIATLQKVAVVFGKRVGLIDPMQARKRLSQ